MKGYSRTFMQLRSSSIILTKRNFNERGVERRHKPNIEQLRFKRDKDGSKLEHKRAYSGTVTVNTRRRIRKAVDTLVQISDWQRVTNPTNQQTFEFKMNFITLTMPAQQEQLTGKIAYKLLLKPFIQTMTRLHSMKHYIWKAELTKQNTIHYHITTNTFIDYRVVRKRWNELLQKNNLLTDYYAKHNHYNPNSTDIHKVYNDEQIEGYLEKYISKLNPNEASVIGKVWDCSLSLKTAKRFNVEFTSEHVEQINDCFINSGIDWFEADYFTVIKFKKLKPFAVLRGYEHTLYNEWLDKIRCFEFARKMRRASRKTERLRFEQLVLNL